MRDLTVILVVLLLLGLGSTAHAADLQEGWYVKIGLVALFGWDYEANAYRGVDWNFTGGLGTFGPFEVTSPDPLYPQRMIYVPTTTDCVPDGTRVELYGEPQISITFPITRLDVSIDTMYDASHMRLEVLVHRLSGLDELLWSQNGSGHVYGTASILGDRVIQPGENVFARVTAVPEPTSLLALAAGVASAISILGRRGK